MQLKATDEADLGKARRVWLSLETAAYYRALPLPLLMVLYHAASDALYARWFHQFDPYYGGLGDRGLTFRWEEADLWTEDTPLRLAGEVRAFLSWRAPSLRLPFVVRRQDAYAAALRLGPTQVRIALQRQAERRPDVLRYSTGSPGAEDASIAITEDEIASALGTVTRAVLHIDERFDPGPSGDQLAIDAYVMLALAFENIGQDDVAGRLAATFFADSTLAGTVEPAFALSAALARGHRVREALELAEQLDGSDDPKVRDASGLFTLPALARSRSLSGPEVEDYRATMTRRIERRLARADAGGAAQESYNLANHFRSHEDPREAIRLYDEAARHDPSYLERVYYWHERAGALFFAQRYEEAADAYARASDQGGEPLAKALRADSLLFAGRYAEAHQLFTAFNAEEENDNPRLAEYRLKELISHMIVDRLGTGKQERRPEDAHRLAVSVVGEAKPEEAARILKQALRLDAISGAAWANLGMADRLLEDGDSAFVDLIAAALLLETDAEVWAQTVVQAALTKDGGNLIGDLLVTGRRLAGEANILDQVVHLVGQFPADFPRDEFLRTVEHILESLPPEPSEGFTVRFPTAEGGDEESYFVPEGPE